MRLGLSSFTFGWAVGVPAQGSIRPLDENGLLDKCVAHEVNLLQIGDNLPLRTFDSARVNSLATRASQENVQLEIGARRLTPERVSEHVAIARQLGARLIRFIIDDADYCPDPETVIAVLRESASMLDGLALSLENHDRFPAATLRDIVEAADDDRIGICLDTANSLGAGEGLDTVIATLGPLTTNLHLKDFSIERLPHLMGFTVSGRPAGSGFLNVPKLLRQLAPFHRCRTAIVELWTPPEPGILETITKESAWATQSLEYLKPFFDE